MRLCARMYLSVHVPGNKLEKWWLRLPLQTLLHAVSPTPDISVVVTADFLLCVRVTDGMRASAKECRSVRPHQQKLEK